MPRQAGKVRTSTGWPTAICSTTAGCTVLTVLLALEVSSALLAHTRLALALLVLWLAVYLGRPTWGRLADLLPIEEGPLSHRFIGGVPVRGAAN